MHIIRRVRFPASLLFLLFAIASTALPKPSFAKIKEKDGINWVGWSDDLFERSKKEKKLVILDLEAIWCHWCHVMEETTYANAKVKALLAKHFIAVRVDQDARPDLSARYEDFGWPATILFAPDGKEIAKRAGYIPPEAMLIMLQAFVDDPTPGPSISPEETAVVAEGHSLSKETRANQERLFKAAYDKKQGSWGFNQKFLNWNATELAIKKAALGDKEAEDMAKQTLEAQKNLIDPVWGGVYQYSTGGVWTEKHFEKIMQFQAENMKIYSLAYAQWKDPSYKSSIEAIAKFLNTFLLSPEGSYYTSQDADVVQGKHSDDYFKLDDKARRKKGIPRIDKNRYARENAWVVQAMTSAYAATGEDQYLAAAIKASDWVTKERSISGGGFKHGESEKDGPYLGDTLAMGQAYLALYAVTADRALLQRAVSAADFIDKNFRAGPKAAGYLSSKSMLAGTFAPAPNLDENINLARFSNLLFHYSGEAKHQEMARFAMRYLASPQLSDRFSAGTLLVDLEESVSPIHITVVGKKADPAAKALFLAAAAYPGTYKRMDWLDIAEGPLPNTQAQYPTLKDAAAFACSATRCSLPARNPAQIAERVAQISK
ncbi:MAG: thioredoxin domain-containing protein [Proteobacteria bacterium]|nr:MAG: thioredoxin domain-containing protein [Pseudomonadota bacterium]